MTRPPYYTCRRPRTHPRHLPRTKKEKEKEKKSAAEKGKQITAVVVTGLGIFVSPGINSI
jgi:hypothetical protein